MMPRDRLRSGCFILAALITATSWCWPDAARAQGPQAPGELPFSTIVRRPSLSPYTALGFQGSNPQTGGTLGAIQGLVRPQQQQFAQQLQTQRQSRQLKQLQGQVRQIQQTPTKPLEPMIRATGHASTFQFLSHFYPAAR